MNPGEALKIFVDCQRAFKLAFGALPGGPVVLADLAKFCRANENAAVPGDHDRTWALIGRREVYLYIRDFLDLTPEQLVEKFTKEVPQQER